MRTRLIQRRSAASFLPDDLVAAQLRIACIFTRLKQMPDMDQFAEWVRSAEGVNAYLYIALTRGCVDALAPF